MAKPTLTAAERLDRMASEEELLIYVTGLLRVHHWHWNHSRDSRRSNPGLPDLICVRKGRIIFAELKREVGGKVSHAQQSWFYELGLNHCVEVYLWKPSDMAEIARILA